VWIDFVIMLKLCTVLIGVQGALVRRDDHGSELQRQEEKRAAPVVPPGSTPDGNLAALWGCKSDEKCVTRHWTAEKYEKECHDSPTCNLLGIATPYGAY